MQKDDFIITWTWGAGAERAALGVWGGGVHAVSLVEEGDKVSL